MRRSKILMVIPNLNFGGAQRVFHEHSMYFSRRHEVTECVFNLELGVAFPGAQRLESLDVPGAATPTRKAVRFAQRVRRLRDLKRRLTPDVCISHLEGADYVNVLSRGAERVVLCVHGTKLHDENISGALGLLRKRVMIPSLYRRADAVVTVSRAIREELVGPFGVPEALVTAIPNGFDGDELRRLASAEVEPRWQRWFAEHEVVVTSGRLARQKNQGELLHVFARVARARPSARLLLLGDGELRGALEAQCDALGLTRSTDVEGAAQVVFAGYQRNPFRLLSRAALFVLPSGWEGFPMALGEAMACGVPVVSTDCPTGPRELLSEGDAAPRALTQPELHEAGVLMPMLAGGDAARDTWAALVVSLLGDAPRRAALARSAVERVRAFDREALLQRWEAVVT